MIFLRPPLSPTRRSRRLLRGIGQFRPVTSPGMSAEPWHTFAMPWAGMPRTWQRRVRVGSASTSAHTPMLPMPELLDVLKAATATLTAVARAAPPGARAYHNYGMADISGFLAMGCDEILVHCWDAVRGLGEEFAPPAELADRVLRRLFPWAPTNESPWQALLWANGRTDLPGKERLGPDWARHCAPLDEWDGAVPRQDGNPPNCYEWDHNARRWNPSW
jgi:hypothetical protein